MKNITNINWVIGVDTTLHKFQNDQGKDILLPFVSYHVPTTDVHLFLPQTYHQIHGGHSRISGDSVEMYCKGNRIVIPIWHEQENLTIVYNYFLSTQEDKNIGPHTWYAMAYYNLSTLDFLGDIKTSKDMISEKMVLEI